VTRDALERETGLVAINWEESHMLLSIIAWPNDESFYTQSSVGLSHIEVHVTAPWKQLVAVGLGLGLGLRLC